MAVPNPTPGHQHNRGALRIEARPAGRAAAVCVVGSSPRPARQATQATISHHRRSHHLTSSSPSLTHHRSPTANPPIAPVSLPIALPLYHRHSHITVIVTPNLSPYHITVISGLRRPDPGCSPSAGWVRLPGPPGAGLVGVACSSCSHRATPPNYTTKQPDPNHRSVGCRSASIGASEPEQAAPAGSIEDGDAGQPTRSGWFDAGSAHATEQSHIGWSSRRQSCEPPG